MKTLPEQLGVFCERAGQDSRLQPTHVSLYLALLREWGRHGYTSTFIISRREIMRIARISSRVTYHRRMRELHRYGYIRYEPTYNYYHGTRVCLC